MIPICDVQRDHAQQKQENLMYVEGDDGQSWSVEDRCKGDYCKCLVQQILASYVFFGFGHHQVNDLVLHSPAEATRVSLMLSQRLLSSKPSCSIISGSSSVMSAGRRILTNFCK